jgi:hypothetical protein
LGRVVGSSVEWDEAAVEQREWDEAAAEEWESDEAAAEEWESGEAAAEEWEEAQDAEHRRPIRLPARAPNRLGGLKETLSSSSKTSRPARGSSSNNSRP